VLITLLNVIWLIFGGAIMALLWVLAGVIMAITIIGIPWAPACFVVAGYTLWPFGRELISRKVLTDQDDVGTGTLGLIGNILWFVLAGIWLALSHVGTAIAFAITLVGIPFAWGHLKIAAASLAPIGKTVVTTEEAAEARRRAAAAAVDGYRA
jgi:uncharacterized membrane protein YccF (DUF307 family)